MLPAQQTFPCQLSARLTIWCCGERTQSHARELPGRATSSSVRLPTNLHVQCRKGGTPVRCCVSITGWVNTSNKRLKVGASFPGFYFLQKTRLARLPLHFYVFTCPTQRVLISRWMPARCSRPDKSCFLLSLPVQHGESWSPVGRRRGAPGQTILLSLSLPVQHSKS